MVIEVDGKYHNEKPFKDATAEEIYNYLGLKVIRYENKDIKYIGKAFLKDINEFITEKRSYIASDNIDQYLQKTSTIQKHYSRILLLNIAVWMKIHELKQVFLAYGEPEATSVGIAWRLFKEGEEFKETRRNIKRKVERLRRRVKKESGI